MSPKRAHPKAKAKAKAKVALRRPAGRVLRRPGAAVGEPPPPVPVDPVRDFQQGVATPLKDLPLAAFKLGSRLVVTEGSYYGGSCRAAGTLR